MASEPATQRYRDWYVRLLRLYPKRHRERFGEGMAQTFNDLCRERVEEGFHSFILWILVDTSAGIIRENIRSILTQKHMMRAARVTACILLVPFLGNQFVDGWNWALADFIVWGIILFSSGVVYELVARKGKTIWYRAGVGPVNLMYFGVPAVGMIGALMARLEAGGMARTLFAVALAQMLVPVIALVIWNPPFQPGVGPVFILNGIFSALWAGSALLFRRASSTGQLERPT